MRIHAILAILFISLVTFSFSGSTVLAQTSVGDLTSSITDPGAVNIGESLIYPGTPLYFLKSVVEKVEMKLASTNSAKAVRQLEFAQRRLREVNSLVKNKQQDFIPSALEQYKLALNQALKFANGNQDLEPKIGEDVSRHLDVLERVYDQVGNPRAKIAIKTAMEKAVELDRDLLGKLNLEHQQALISATATRQAFACKFFAREATSSALNEVEKEELGQQIKACEQSVKTDLKDELEETKAKKEQNKIEEKDSEKLLPTQAVRKNSR